MIFNFGETAGNSQNTTQQLEGNKIHEVTFEGCEARDFDGVQDNTRKFKVLDIKFKNAQGIFTHTIWEPQDGDDKDTPNAYGGNNPSRVLQMLYLVKHLIDTVNPELSKKIDSGEESFKVTSWDAFRRFVVEATTPGKGITTKIKLIKNNKGEAAFPSFFLNYNKMGKLYMNTNFIGSNIIFTTRELDKIKKAASAQPSKVNSGPSLETFDSVPEADPFSSERFDMTF